MNLLSKIKKILVILTVISMPGFAMAEAAPEVVEPSLDKEIGYFFGYSFGNALLNGGNEGVDIESVMSGIKDSLERKDPALDESRQGAVIAEIEGRRQALLDLQVSRMLESSQVYMTQNKSQEGVKETESGLQYLVVEEGTGASPTSDDTVVVHYEGRLINDQVFDSSLQRGEPARFTVGGVIAGWEEGLQLMKVGGKIRLFIPPDLGYGPGGTRSGIPPNAVLIFDVQLIEIAAQEEAVSE